MLFDGFEPFTVTTRTNPDVTIFGLKSVGASSTLPPLLLLHGFPQSHHIWHRVTPRLIHNYNIVIIDLRGYGKSSKPDDVQHYAKSAMASDCVAVMDSLGFTCPFFVCGHDRGARVAHKLCVDYSERVRKVLLLDICPTLAMYSKTDFRFASLYFHWFMLIQPEPIPETFLNACPRKFAEMALAGGDQAQIDMFGHECFEYYVSVLETPATVHSMCQDYRASATLDLAEAKDDLKQGRLVRCPLRVLWAKKGVIEKCFDALSEWRAVVEADVVVDGGSLDTGHFIPESAPDDVVSNILEFFV